MEDNLKCFNLKYFNLEYDLKYYNLEDDLKDFNLEDNLKYLNTVYDLKYFNLEDNLKDSCKWMMTPNTFINGRRPQISLLMEDDLKLFKLKMEWMLVTLLCGSKSKVVDFVTKFEC